MKTSGLEAYEIRRGGDGKVGIYTRGYDVRMATFNANSASLQRALKGVFDRAVAAQRKAEALRRATSCGSVNILQAATSKPRKFNPTPPRDGGEG